MEDKDRSGNPYRRFFTRDRTARDLLRQRPEPPAAKPAGEEDAPAPPAPARQKE